MVGRNLTEKLYVNGIFCGLSNKIIRIKTPVSFICYLSPIILAKHVFSWLKGP